MEICLQNRQRKLRVDVSALRRFSEKAIESVLTLDPQNNDALGSLEEISIVLVSDRAMAKLHLDFMGIKGPTDVLTFEHGEILISTETAARYSTEYGHSVQQEISLYILHGLLHLRGYDDISPDERRKMHQVQNALFEKLNFAL